MFFLNVYIIHWKLLKDIYEYQFHKNNSDNNKSGLHDPITRPPVQSVRVGLVDKAGGRPAVISRCSADEAEANCGDGPDAVALNATAQLPHTGLGRVK